MVGTPAEGFRSKADDRGLLDDEPQGRMVWRVAAAGGATGCLRAVIPALMGRVPGPLGAPAVGVAPVVEVVAEITRRRGGVTYSDQRLLRVWSQRGR